ncbi:hypothetical protein K438DRAFT_357717 [Mycena galopus ATCC 62051]|nr:hypothetical protein K438DRAFT_357717 [Mycena galopus ATCC 62051]
MRSRVRSGAKRSTYTKGRRQSELRSGRGARAGDDILPAHISQRPRAEIIPTPISALFSARLQLPLRLASYVLPVHLAANHLSLSPPDTYSPNEARTLGRQHITVTPHAARPPTPPQMISVCTLTVSSNQAANRKPNNIYPADLVSACEPPCLTPSDITRCRF